MLIIRYLCVELRSVLCFWRLFSTKKTSEIRLFSIKKTSEIRLEKASMKDFLFYTGYAGLLNFDRAALITMGNW